MFYGHHYSYGQYVSPYIPSPNEEDDEDGTWTEEEDRLMMDRKLCFDEVNVLLRGRSEPEIWRRMGKLRWGRGGSESSASGESDMGAFSPLDAHRGTIKLPPVPASRVLRSQDSMMQR